MPLIKLSSGVRIIYRLGQRDLYDCWVSEAAFESLPSSVTIPKYVFFNPEKIISKEHYFIKMKILQHKEINLSQLGIKLNLWPSYKHCSKRRVPRSNKCETNKLNLFHCNCDDQSSLHIFLRSSNMWSFTCIRHLLRVYYELTKCPATRWLDSSVGRARHSGIVEVMGSNPVQA